LQERCPVSAMISFFSRVLSNNKETQNGFAEKMADKKDG